MASSQHAPVYLGRKTPQPAPVGMGGSTRPCTLRHPLATDLLVMKLLLTLSTSARPEPRSSRLLLVSSGSSR